MIEKYFIKYIMYDKCIMCRTIIMLELDSNGAPMESYLFVHSFL